jgi:uncharacterized Zn-binding protein involved in type VI secretion
MYRALFTASLALALGSAMSPASAEMKTCVTVNDTTTCVTGKHSVEQTVVNGKSVLKVDGKVVEMKDVPSSNGNVVIQRVTGATDSKTQIQPKDEEDDDD